MGTLRTLVLSVAVAVAATSPLAAQERWFEKDYRDALCQEFEREKRLAPHSIADCVSETHAIEVEWADNWKEGVGQALAYAMVSSLIPGVILVCKDGLSDEYCLDASLTVQETFSTFGIEATVWECAARDRKLSDCIEKSVLPRPEQ